MLLRTAQVVRYNIQKKFKKGIKNNQRCHVSFMQMYGARTVCV